MGLNIKNEHTHQLVRRLADLTGSSQTSAVEDAVQRRLEELLAERGDGARERAERRDRVDGLLADVRADLTDEDRAALRGADTDLYDDAGMPA
ncbi:type II toxin-antitoxin system VapB family antitoxin [Isoptericola croceus]|uniref:type II toxin-antitoxin system VapB family antitoxin n=1 Tax=Isoptericola croceus TaxID=3031406 RepID=UPI0023F9D527|nr:type II toxin-antitoxin system VapB family antitoxin [Isoptericola croceus]